MRWFDWTYDVTGEWAPRWTRIAWPGSGGIGDQEAWLVQALRHVEATEDAMLGEDVKARRRDNTKRT